MWVKGQIIYSKEKIRQQVTTHLLKDMIENAMTLTTNEKIQKSGRWQETRTSNTSVIQQKRWWLLDRPFCDWLDPITNKKNRDKNNRFLTTSSTGDVMRFRFTQLSHADLWSYKRACEEPPFVAWLCAVKSFRYGTFISYVKSKH